MISKKDGLVTAGLAILCIFFATVYVSVSSCTRPLEDNPWACNYVYCQNGGRCDSAKCKCPTGFEGTDCSVATIEKFLGNWRMHVTYVGSDSAGLVGKDTTYISDWKATATSTTFFINRFDDNPYYNNVTCVLDTVDKNRFNMDTTAVLNMMYDHYRIRKGWGVIYNGDSISAWIAVRRLNATVNWQNDTIVLAARKL